MPSLRRSLSSPSVRSSPYLSSGGPTRSRQLPRRSSGSSTADRRVLADIEWWRVSDGQCDNPTEPQPQDISPDASPGPSVHSTPQLHTAPLESVLGFAIPFSCPFGDLYPSSLTRAAPRSVSAPHQPTSTPDFADMGGDSFSLDQNLFR